jgi:predicted membrane protein
MMHEIPTLNRQQLRNFGFLTGAIFVVLFSLLLPWIKGHSLAIWPWIIAFPLWFLGILSPNSLKPVYQVWMRIGLVLGWINTRIILGIVFYLILFPMGLIARLLNDDPLEQKFNRKLVTYRTESHPIKQLNMEKPY